MQSYATKDGSLEMQSSGTTIQINSLKLHTTAAERWMTIVTTHCGCSMTPGSLPALPGTPDYRRASAIFFTAIQQENKQQRHSAAAVYANH